MPRKKILVMAFSTINRDARVLRQITYLSRHYDIIVIGYGEPVQLPGVEMISLDNHASEGGGSNRLIKKKDILGKNLHAII